MGNYYMYESLIYCETIIIVKDFEMYEAQLMVGCVEVVVMCDQPKTK